MKVAALQMVSGVSVQANLEAARALLEEAAALGAELAVLPEYFCLGSERYDETRVIERGGEPITFDLPARGGKVWRIGMSVCYDLRFPELYRVLAADVLLAPSAFTHVTGQAHWEVLLRARAIENLAYVVAPAQGGVHENGRRTWGHSMVVDPWGQVMAQRDEGPAVVLAEMDRTRQAQLRTQLPALEHRVL